MERLPIAGPSITQREIDYAADAATHGWYERAGEYQRRFEEGFAAYLGVKHAVSLPSCTSGLHLALAALGIGPGDEVIVPDLTWIASAAPVHYVGATPVFADVDEQTWCLSAESVRTCLTENTKA
nr:aminotransferase class I/II-fold pyridoxal phosphate-dependent enzyme [Dehalococcoidia bacterium]